MRRSTTLWVPICLFVWTVSPAELLAAGPVVSISAGDLHLVLQQANGGVQLQSLFDSKSNHEHLPASPATLFRITLHNTLTGAQKTLVADQGWDQVAPQGRGLASVGDPLAAPFNRGPG